MTKETKEKTQEPAKKSQLGDAPRAKYKNRCALE